MLHAVSHTGIPSPQRVHARLSPYLRLVGAILFFVGSSFHGVFAADIPLSEFAKLPAYDDIKISPSGAYLAAKIRTENEEESLVFMDMKTKQVTTVLTGRKRERIVDYIWANDERVVLWVGKKYGTLDAPVATDNVVGVNWDGTKREQLLGIDDNRSIPVNPKFRFAELLHRLPNDDKNILIAINNLANRDSTFTQVLKLNIYTGKTRKVETAPMRGAEVITDNSGDVRLSVSTDPDKENAVVIHQHDGKDWQLLGEFHGKEGTLTPVGFTPDNKFAYMLDNRTTNTDSLYLFNMDSREQELLYTHKIVDIEDLEHDPDGNVVGIYIEPDYPDYVPLAAEEPMAKWLVEVHEVLRGYRVRMTSMTRDGRLAILRASSDRLPARYFLFETETKQLSAIAAAMPGLDEASLRPVEPYALKVRDGTVVYAYLTRPEDSDGPFPMVVLPHGGPHGVRDYWAYDGYAQMLASRGYAVLKVNYRGSGGYGRDFLYTGYGKWGTLMQDDVTDATLWAINEGITDSESVCIFGGSYGGYAAMMGAVREPDLYQCVIAYVGVYDLELMFKEGDIPTRESGMVYLKQAVGEDKADLRARSPVHNLDRVKAPVFIVHGAEDFRVDIKHAYKLRDGLKKLGKPYEWMVKPNEGHGFYRPENREELFERMLAFLGKYIGGGVQTAESVADRRKE